MSSIDIYRSKLVFIIGGMTGFCVVVIAIMGIGTLKGITYEVKDEISKYDNGMVEEIWIYKKNIINIFGKGEKIKELRYYNNGILESAIDYKSGKVNGQIMKWNEDGTLFLQAFYKDNKAHGTRVAYHKNGKIFCLAQFEDDKLIWKRNWDEEGNDIGAIMPEDRY